MKELVFSTNTPDRFLIFLIILVKFSEIHFVFQLMEKHIHVVVLLQLL
nr:MAG TPA: hypothetical protein [Caudoviricetes sp.]DAT87484.1 MAG TPA: hypothetical protein [Caudoviricetes sp.]